MGGRKGEGGGGEVQDLGVEVPASSTHHKGSLISCCGVICRVGAFRVG